MKQLIRFFAKEHLFGNIITALIFIIGLFSLYSIRRDIWPEINFDLTIISSTLIGASPEQIEKLLINPIEESLREVDGIKKVFSTATENQAIIIAQLDSDSRDSKETNKDIQQSIDRLSDLPKDSSKPNVRIIESGSEPVIEVTIDGSLSKMELRNFAKHIADELGLLKGVSKVTKRGFRKKEFVVEANLDQLKDRRISLTSLIGSIQRRNISLPGGTLTDKDSIEYIVRTDSEFTSTDDIKITPISYNEGGFGSKIEDVAKVYEDLAPAEQIYRSNGQSGINLLVAKKKNSDALTLVGSIKEKVTQLAEKIPSGVNLGISNDFSIYLSQRLNSLTSNLLIGLLLVILVLSAFLPWRVTLVVAIGIPVALLTCFTISTYFGISLNLISLIGLIIVLGMLVDDAIVVSENIWSHLESGEGTTESIVKGTTEVLGPVLASVLTTVSAFSPMLFMTGIFGAFVFQIPLMVIIALGISLLEAFFIMPSHFGSWVVPYVKEISNIEKKSHWFTGLLSKYKNYLAWSIRRRYIVLSGAIGLLVLTVSILIYTGRFILFPPGSVELLFVSLEGPRGASLEHMEQLVIPIEKQILELPKDDLLDIVTSIGIVQQGTIDPQTKRGANFAQIRVSLTPKSKRKKTANEIVEYLREKIEVPKEIKNISFEFAREGPPQGRPISINILGKDFKTLSLIGERIKELLNKQKGVVDIKDSFVYGKKEWNITPKLYESSVLGLSPVDISNAVRASFAGVIASSVRDFDEEIDVRVKLEESRTSALEQLNSLNVGNSIGNLIPISKVANFKLTESLSSISHLQNERVLNISAEVNLSETTASFVMNSIKDELANILKDHSEYSLSLGGEDEDTKESFQSLGKAFAFATFFIFALLIITFKNFTQPLLILTSIPLGFMGVIISMFIHNRPFSFMAMLGVIALAGVIVNNAIVLIDFVNKSRESGSNNDDSIIDSALKRLRPIILTTATTVCGLLPTAYGEELQKLIGIGGGDPFIVPIALSLGWGLGFGSVLTLLLFPAFIRIVDDIQGLFKRKKSI